MHSILGEDVNTRHARRRRGPSSPVGLTNQQLVQEHWQLGLDLTESDDRLALPHGSFSITPHIEPVLPLRVST